MAIGQHAVMRLLLPGLLAIAACGDTVDDQPLRVELSKTSSGLLDIPVSVYVADADGTSRLAGPAPGNTFEVPIRSGASISIHEDASSSPTSRSSTVMTIRELEPGDVVQHGFRFDDQPWPSATLPSMTLRYTPAPGATAATQYMVATTCAENGWGVEGVVRLPFREDCRPSAPFDLFLYTWTPERTGEWMQVMRGVTYVEDGELVAPATWVAMPTIPVTIHGLPADATGVGVDRSSTGIADLRAPTLTPTAASATVQLPVLPGQPGLATIMVDTTRASAIGIQRHTLVVRADATALELDLARYPLPWITSLPAEGSGDETWTQSGPGVADVAEVEKSSWTPDGPPFSGGSSTVLSSGTLHTGAPAGTRLTLIDHPAVASYAEIRHDHKQRYRPLTEGQVKVESIAPADISY